MLIVVSWFVPFAERHQQLFPIVRELEHLMMDIVDHPDVVLGIVRTDGDRVRAATIFEKLVPLCPRLDDLAACVNDNDAIAKLRRRRGRLLAERAPVTVKT